MKFENPHQRISDLELIQEKLIELLKTEHQIVVGEFESGIHNEDNRNLCELCQYLKELEETK